MEMELRTKFFNWQRNNGPGEKWSESYNLQKTHQEPKINVYKCKHQSNTNLLSIIPYTNKLNQLL